MCYWCYALGELSDEYQTDYDEEVVDSALSDFEAFQQGSEHTEGEETAETVCKNKRYIYPAGKTGPDQIIFKSYQIMSDLFMTFLLNRMHIVCYYGLLW